MGLKCFFLKILKDEILLEFGSARKAYVMKFRNIDLQLVGIFTIKFWEEWRMYH